MEPISGVLLFSMGILAGIINSAVGSGSLLTLPVLLAVGIPPGVAVRTNTIGMMFASFGTVYGFRKEIARELPHLVPMSIATIVFSALGSILLLGASTRALDFVIPVLIVFALALVIFQQQIIRVLSRCSSRSKTVETQAEPSAELHEPVGSVYRKPGLIAPMGLAAMYGGFFTAAQGILYMAILGVGTGRSFKDVNPAKNFLSMIVNVTAAAVYIIAFFFFGSEVLWIGVVILACGGLLGGVVGARIAKKVSNHVLKAVIVVVALVALVRQFV
ncbi:sulfite exporter TauE/SafE family protein [Corynebacterium propinquum]|uniref:Probable membrane transporter protein n=1 Tax=Corynebacterium propinquum TaxID=43769 RepID=A0AAP4BUH7_9CORY|nr:sulfite exporter TauE/SafE family protein [Corynebacterium propinquum]MDK4326684.1 sulfite exporter TauE/SafE family protein [Corynebacterium propinquum]MDK8666481.1 sulfite exporter TauE/SafE family protein [Corynebacterium propinquum]MDK8723568.1 sulfite exporter TauE/SafE family protein [Corynebacterium propinquum]RUP78617.1 sulfite exporter TauE/SafE family protein [Corynebacterium propinquum]RUP88654.1 sulfite exporter TauE/SafE family protein [Corynebacterium propinquum]